MLTIFLETPATIGPIFLPYLRPPLDLTAPQCLALPPAIPSSPADLQIGRKQLLRPTPL